MKVPRNYVPPNPPPFTIGVENRCPAIFLSGRRPILELPRQSSTTCEIFEGSLGWLKETYRQHAFFVERDVVWTIQLALNREIERRGLPFRVFNDYAIVKGPGGRRGLCADLAILNEGGVELAAEFKYEPDHRRRDVLQQKLPVLGWLDMQKDILRVRTFVETGVVRFGYTVFVDEGGFFRHREAHSGSSWIDSATGESELKPSILFSRLSISSHAEGSAGSIAAVQ
jgi:hypothetical protein